MLNISTKHPKCLTTAIFIVFTLAVLLVPSLIRPASIPKNQNDKIIEKLQEVRPDYLFIGNSMLGSRIDQGYFQDLTGAQCHLIWHGGIMSSAWYLIVKNVVAALNNQPKFIFIFFRDTHLTEPHLRVSGNPLKFIDKYRNKNENILDNILMNHPDLTYRYELYLQKLYPLLKYREKLKKKVSYLAGRMTKAISLGSFRDFSVSKTNQLLHFNNFRVAAVDGENNQNHESNYNFNSALKDSFLPLIVNVAEQNDLELFFIRVQRRPALSINPGQSALLEEYISDLEIYFKDKSLQYYDFTGHPELGIDLYGSGDHLNDAGKLKFTDLFVHAILEKTR